MIQNDSFLEIDAHQTLCSGAGQVIQGWENVLQCRALSRGQKARITVPPEVKDQLVAISLAFLKVVYSWHTGTRDTHLSFLHMPR